MHAQHLYKNHVASSLLVAPFTYLRKTGLVEDGDTPIYDALEPGYEPGLPDSHEAFLHRQGFFGWLAHEPKPKVKRSPRTVAKKKTRT